MDEESRHVIERLAEAVDSHNATLEQLIEAVNGPDWWVIGITIVNAAIMAWLGWRQYLLQRQQTKLQEQQVRQQEYEIYQRLYKIVQEMDVVIRYHYYDMFTYYGPLREINKEPFLKKIEQVSNCIDLFDDSRIDLELKFPEEQNIIIQYRDILSLILQVYQLFNAMLETEKAESRDIKNLLQSIPNEEIFREENRKIQAILTLIEDCETKVLLESHLKYFKEVKRNISECNLLGKIRERCKID